MSMARAPDISEMTITMEAIGAEAEQQLDGLCRESQNAVLRLLCERRILRSDCKRVQKIDGLQVYRMRVTRSVRMCFIWIEQKHCIVNIGSKSDFERYCDTRQAAVPNSFVSLSESTVMKKLIARTSQTPVTQELPTARSQQKEPLESNPVYLEAQRIGFALLEMLETGLEGFHSKIDDDIVAQVQLMKDEVDKQIAVLSESARGQTLATLKQFTEFNERISGMLKLIEDHSDALTSIAERMAASERAQVHESQQHQAEMESIEQTTTRLTQRIDQLASRLGGVQKRAGDHQEQVMKYVELLSTRLETMNNSLSAHDTQVERLESQTAAEFSAVDGRMNNQKSAVSALGDRVVALETAVQNLEFEAIRPVRLWRETLTWLRQRKARLTEFLRRYLKGRSTSEGNQSCAGNLTELEH